MGCAARRSGSLAAAQAPGLAGSGVAPARVNAAPPPGNEYCGRAAPEPRRCRSRPEIFDEEPVAFVHALAVLVATLSCTARKDFVALRHGPGLACPGGATSTARPFLGGLGACHLSSASCFPLLVLLRVPPAVGARDARSHSHQFLGMLAGATLILAVGLVDDLRRRAGALQARPPKSSAAGGRLRHRLPRSPGSNILLVGAVSTGLLAAPAHGRLDRRHHQRRQSHRRP